jgi:hypothetical protein
VVLGVKARGERVRLSCAVAPLSSVLVALLPMFGSLSLPCAALIGPANRLRPVGPGHPANNVGGDQRPVRRIPHEHGVGSRQRDKGRRLGRAGAHHVLLAVLGNDQNLEQSILTIGARHPVGVHDRDASCLLTCSWHGANLKGSRFPGGSWNVVRLDGRRKPPWAFARSLRSSAR